MKKALFALAALCAFCTLTNGALASFSSTKGGFDGPSLKVSTVQMAKTMRDNTPVVLEGYIEKSIGDEKYMFKDATGTIVVEIDDDKWRGITVTPKDKIEISGEVEKDWASVEIDVKSLKKI